VGGTWGTLSAGGAAALFLLALPVVFLVEALLVFLFVSAVVVSSIELGPFGPSGGIEAFEDDKRR
jgi:hypothetical protein